MLIFVSQPELAPPSPGGRSMSVCLGVCVFVCVRVYVCGVWGIGGAEG